MHFEGICGLKTELNYPFKRNNCQYLAKPFSILMVSNGMRNFGSILHFNLLFVLNYH